MLQDANEDNDDAAAAVQRSCIIVQRRRGAEKSAMGRLVPNGMLEYWRDEELDQMNSIPFLVVWAFLNFFRLPLLRSFRLLLCLSFSFCGDWGGLL